MAKLVRIFSVLFFCVICFMFTGCIDEKVLKARMLQAKQEKLQEEERIKQENLQEKERIKNEPFDILTVESTRKKGSGEISIRWESNRDVPLKLDVLDRNDDGLTYTIKPTCLENGHCVYDVSFCAPIGRNVYLTFYSPKGNVFLEHTIHVPDLEDMVLNEEVF